MLLYNVGYFGPVLIFFIIAPHIVTGHLDLVLLQFLNMGVNLVLKDLIRAPRPKHPISVNRWDKLDESQFGMPSLHAQLVVGMWVYALLHLRDTVVPLVVGLLAGGTLWQRYVCRKHTPLQLAAGALLGATLCLLFELDAFGWREMKLLL